MRTEEEGTWKVIIVGYIEVGIVGYIENNHRNIEILVKAFNYSISLI